MHSSKFGVVVALVGFCLFGCGPDPIPGAGSGGTESGSESATGDGDGDPSTSGDGDGDPSTSGDGDGDPATSGDGDGEPAGDGDGDPTTGDGDGDPMGDGDGDMTGDGDGDMTGDGDGDMMGDGDGDPDEPPNPGGLPNGASCTNDVECAWLNCYIVPFLGGQCGECNEDADCPDGGCTPPNPFGNTGSTCNMGEPGGGCESNQVCQPGLTCENVLDILGLIQINTCGHCSGDQDCDMGQICSPLVDVQAFSGLNDCIDPGTLMQDDFCDLFGNGNQACASGICSSVDIMGLAEVGACGECITDLDCAGNQICAAGNFNINLGELTGSTCI